MIVSRRRADLAFWSLLFLAALVAAGFIAQALSSPWPLAPIEACQTAHATILAHMDTVAAGLPRVTLWVIGLATAFSMIHQAWVTRRTLTRLLEGRRPLTKKIARVVKTLDLDDRVDLIDDPVVFTFCYGFRQPRIMLSRGLCEMLDVDELEAVLRHEAHHLEHRDPVKILLVRSLASGLFFLPLAAAFRNSFLAAKELSADADAVVAGVDRLASALYKMLSAPKPDWPAGVLAVGAMSPTELRVAHLLEIHSEEPLLPGLAVWARSALVLSLLFGANSLLAERAQAASQPAIASLCTSPHLTVSPADSSAASSESDAFLQSEGLSDSGGQFASDPMFDSSELLLSSAEDGENHPLADEIKMTESNTPNPDSFIGVLPHPFESQELHGQQEHDECAMPWWPACALMTCQLSPR